MLGTLAFFVIAFLIRAQGFQHEPLTDELYHLLAAKSWAENGTLAIADGEYLRASVFTRMLGAVHLASDGNVNAIRIFCIFIGSLLVASVFAWTARIIGPLEGAIAASLLALMPGAIFLSQHIRFYSLHALVFFWLACVAYSVVLSPMSARRRYLLVLLALLLTGLAVHLQITTMIGIGAMAVWAFLVKSPAIYAWVRGNRRNAILLLLAIMLPLLLVILAREKVFELLDMYQASALWNSGDSPAFYHRLYNAQFGWLWALFPIAFLVALTRRPLPAFFCACIFCIALVAQSLGGMRAERFLFYAMPYFFIAWAIAITAAGRALVSSVSALLGGTWAPGTTKFRSHGIAIILVTVTSMFLVIATPATETVVNMVSGKELSSDGRSDYWDRYETNWAAAGPSLRKLSSTVDIVIVSQPLHALYFVGDFDYALNATMLADAVSLGADGSRDPRTGREVFADAAFLQNLLACNNSGLVIIHGPAWRNETRVPSDVADVIEARMTKLEVSDRWNLLVFQWTSSPEGLDCRMVQPSNEVSIDNLDQ